MPFEEEITKHIGLPESNRLKYEALLPSSNEIGRTISAFCNTEGGILILGILNHYNKITVKGLSDDFQVNVVLKNALAKLSSDALVQHGFIFKDGKKLFAIKAEKSIKLISYNKIEYEIKAKRIQRLNSSNIDTQNRSTQVNTISNNENSQKGKNIFISYNWAHKTAAKNLYEFLKEVGFSPSMDDHSLIYKSKISSFMESIREADFAVLIISDEYLKSENCMTEIMHVLKDRNSAEKILPIRHEYVKIFKPADRIKYVNYWKLQVEEREHLLIGVDVTSAIEEIKKLKIAKSIYQDIGDFLSDIADMISTTIEEQEKTNYKSIMEYIEG